MKTSGFPFPYFHRYMFAAVGLSIVIACKTVGKENTLADMGRHSARYLKIMPFKAPPAAKIIIPRFMTALQRQFIRDNTFTLVSDKRKAAYILQGAVRKYRSDLDTVIEYGGRIEGRVILVVSFRMVLRKNRKTIASESRLSEISTFYRQAGDHRIMHIAEENLFRSTARKIVSRCVGGLE